MYFVLTVAALTENRNCISVGMASTRFIESKVRVVTSLNKNKDPEPRKKLYHPQHRQKQNHQKVQNTKDTDENIAGNAKFNPI